METYGYLIELAPRLAPVIALFATWCGTDRVILVKAVRRIWQVLFK